MLNQAIARLFFLLFIFFTGITLQAQWLPDVRLTTNSAASYMSFNNVWSIAANGNSVHVVWYDERVGNQEIYYKRSTNNGQSWGADARLSYDVNVSEDPCVVAAGSIVIVTWSDNRNSADYEIYMIRSTDGGSIWGLETRLTNSSGSSYTPCMVISGSLVHMVWEDYRDGNREIYYKRSTNSGAAWGADVRLTNNTAQSWYPSLSVPGSNVHVSWQDNRDANYEIYYKRSTDAGLTWGADTRLTNNTGTSWYTCIGSSGSLVHTVWEESRDFNYEVYYKKSSDNGLTWGVDTRLTNNVSSSEYPSLTVSNSNLHIVWQEARDGNLEVYYKRSSDAGLTWGTDTRLTNNSASSFHPSIAFSGAALHVVWYDTRDTNQEIYYKRDTTGNPVSIHQLSSEAPKQFSVAQNYPNPFNPVTKIKFDIGEFPLNKGVGAERRGLYVSLKIFDILGREVATLINEQLKPGTYEIEWDASEFPSGVYYYRFESSAGDFAASKKMILLK